MTNKKTNLILISVAIVVLGYIGYSKYEERRVKDRVEMYLEQAKIEQQIDNEREKKLNDCITEVDNRYWEYMQLNGSTSIKNGKEVVNAPQQIWDNAAKTKEQGEDTCFKRYGK